VISSVVFVPESLAVVISSDHGAEDGAQVVSIQFIVTVHTFESTVQSFTLYVNVSVPI